MMNRYNSLYSVILVVLFASQMMGQKLAVFTVSSGPYARLNSVVSASLGGMVLNSEEYDLQLRELIDGQQVPVPSQLEGGIETKIWWIMSGSTLPNQKRIYELWKMPNGSDQSTLSILDDGKNLNVQVGEKPVLSYRYEKADLPPGVGAEFSRGGYIHPLWSPSGEELTRIQPPDHHHHYGIWNPWTHTEYEGQEVDFWNLGKKQGRVDLATKPVYEVGPVYADIKSELDHNVLSDSSREESETALNEKMEIRVWNADKAENGWVVDVVSTLSCATESPLTIKEYRYQGFGYRAKAGWNDDNTTLLTDEGFNKENGNATRAKWCDVRGPSNAGKSGILFMTNPANYNFPEQLRIWPTGTNKGVDNVFVNFNPAQDRDWELEPGKSYTLKYRMFVYDGDISPEKANLIWNDYAHPVEVKIDRPNSLKGKKILVYTKNGKGYVHDNLAASVAAIKKLGKENGFLVDATDSASIFTSPGLSDYDAIVFSSTNNETFDTERQKIAFQNYIRNGGGFVGIHSATGSERSWPWYWKLIGGKFMRHPAFQQFEIEIIDRDHPSTNFLPDIWVREDECYFTNQMNPANHVLLAARLPKIVDEKKNDYPGETWGELVPIAWCHEFDGGRQWYTALGHAIEHYQDPTLMRHILGGIEWVCTKD
ncbi:MAG: PmoA family protein [Saprospiraceae bacterium]|nr:PmoA family protein [Saprospiraceae bacterium]